MRRGWENANDDHARVANAKAAGRRDDARETKDRELPISDCQLSIAKASMIEPLIGNWQLAIANLRIGNRQLEMVKQLC